MLANASAVAAPRSISTIKCSAGLPYGTPPLASSAGTAAAVKAAKGGKVDFRMDRTGNVCVVCGKRSFEADKLAENIKTVIGAVKAERPAGAKGNFIRSLTLSSTMGVGVLIKAEEGE